MWIGQREVNVELDERSQGHLVSGGSRDNGSASEEQVFTHADEQRCEHGLLAWGMLVDGWPARAAAGMQPPSSSASLPLDRPLSEQIS